MLPPDHEQRLILVEEVHARPPEPLETPCRATYVALLVAPHARERELAHVVELCESYAVAPPDRGVTQFSTQL